VKQSVKPFMGRRLPRYALNDGVFLTFAEISTNELKKSKTLQNKPLLLLKIEIIIRKLCGVAHFLIERLLSI
jgi:hypothetical protein